MKQLQFSFLDSFYNHTKRHLHIKYQINILYTNVSGENIRRIKKYEKENINIEFVDLNKQLEDIKEKLYTRNYFSNTTYYRLFIPELYPEYKKAIYIDSDTIC